MKKLLLFNRGKQSHPVASVILRTVKLTCLLIIIGCIQVSALAFSQRISLSVQNAPLERVIKLITAQSGYQFIYNSELLEKSRPVTINVKNTDLGEVLKRCFDNQPFTYLVQDKTIIVKQGVSAKKLENTAPAATETEIRGKVSDEKGAALPGASILLKGHTQGTTTDVNGEFIFNIPVNQGILVISSIGFVTKEVPFKDQNAFQIQLSADVKALEEIVVVGYGTQKKQDLTGAITSVTSKDLQDLPVATVGQMLQGKLAGVRVTQTSGRPGEGMKVQVRGAVSLTAGADPLYVVDGMPISGDISFLNPNDIESITVLKDPASASLYGSRSSNGVVLVQTRTASSGKLQVDYNGYYGFEKVPDGRRLKMMNATEYAQFQKEIAEMNGRTVNPAFQNPQQYGKGTDWFETITQTGAIQSHSASVGGGSGKFNVLASGNYFQQEGVVRETGYTRGSLRLNSSYQVTDKLKVGLNIAPTFTNNKNYNTDGAPYGSESIISAALITTPLASPYNSDGSLALTAVDPATFGNPNWLRVTKERVYRNRALQLISNAYVQYEIIKGLQAKVTFNAETSNRNIFQFNPSTIGTLFNPPPRIPSGSNNESRHYNWVNENTLNYQKKTGEHSFDLLVGFTAQRYRLDRINIAASNYPNDMIQAISAARQTLVTNDVQKWSILSYLSRLNYSFKGKYLLSASIRRDGTSRFGSENRWGSFPAVSAGWLVSDESFFKSIRQVSLLKLRASYGITGNFEIGNYTHLSTVGSVFYPFGNTPTAGMAPNNLGNNMLGWENNEQINLGADINLFNNRVQLVYNYYTKNTKDLLFNVDVPVSSGFNTYQTNVGRLKFWGHEIAVNAAIIKNSKLTWTSDFNISFDRNVTKALATASGVLPHGLQMYSFYSHRTAVGRPVAQFYGAIHEGVYVNKGDYDSSPKEASSQVGTIKFKDINGDGKITFPEDMDYIGNPWPKFTFGLTNNLSYRHFDLSTVIAGSYGNKVISQYENWVTNLDGVFNVLADVKNRWKSEAEPGNGKWGSTQQGTTFLERDRWNSRYVKDASYLVVRNITLGYDMSHLLKGCRLRVYLSSQNPFLLTKYKGSNPEVNTSNSASGFTPGMDQNSYPVPRSLTFGVNFGLK